MFFAIAFALFVAVCTVLAFVRHPIYGVYLYLATTYVYPQGRYWGYVFGDLRWALVAAALTVVAVLVHRGKLAPKPAWVTNLPAVVICIYALWMWVQTPWALDAHEHFEGSSRITKYLIAFWFVYRVADSKEHLRDLLLAQVLGSALLGIYAQYTGREGGRLDGVGGPGIDDSNTLGMYLVVGAILAVTLVLTQPGWRRWVSLVSLALIINGFVLANSRGAFLGLVAGGLVLALCKARKHRRLFWGFTVVALMGLVVVVDKTFVERMFTIQDATSQSDVADRSARSRVVIIEAQAQMFLDYPMGTGHRGTAVLSTRYLDREWLAASRDGDEESRARSSHNTFMTTLVEQGVLGALLYVVVTVWGLGMLAKVRAHDEPGSDPVLVTLAAGICGALAVVWVAGHTADYLMAEIQYWLFASLVSVLLMMRTDSPGSKHPGLSTTLGAGTRLQASTPL